MHLNVGSSGRIIPGFTNVELRRVPGTERGHAGDLRFAEDGSVEILFSSALFEHIFLGQQVLVLREWKRAVGSGIVVCIGLPNFRTLASCYLSGEPGVEGNRFDLWNVYRLTHGAPEMGAVDGWRRWNPMRHPRSAPKGWLPQLHKGIFDAPTLYGLLDAAGLSGTVFSYRYPGEGHDLALGFVAGQNIETGLDAIPGTEQYVERASVAVIPDDGTRDQLAQEAVRLAERPAWKRYARPLYIRLAVWRAQRRWPGGFESTTK